MTLITHLPNYMFVRATDWILSPPHANSLPPRYDYYAPEKKDSPQA